MFLKSRLRRSLAPLCFLPFLLSGCLSDKGGDSPLTPLPASNLSSPLSASEPDLDAAISRFLLSVQAPQSSRYSYTRADLNGDGALDALVAMEAPYGRWCGEHGCTLLVFKAQGDSFEPIQTIRPVRRPVYLMPLTTLGWRDIVVRVAGRDTPAKDVVLQFDGGTYPADPSLLPPYIGRDRQSAVKLFP